MTSDITLYHSPNTRSSGVRILLDELQVPYRLHVLNMRAGEHREAAYLAINPLGKVPAIRHGNAVITEQAAIYLYLADEFAEKGLAPPIGDPLRGPYLRWMILYGSCFEPAVIDRALEREPGPMAMSPYGSFDAVLDSIVAGLSKGPYLLGERFSAADILWGTALGWMTAFKLVPEEPLIVAYVARIKDRPSFRKITAEESALAAQQQEAG
ncbi:glutathione S-transferase family protein [Methylobacterium sp. Leaf106]|uniref:glutathione S-transferase family protein n=1 Tax=Methylobacterium sp. Leaf106 TaxID=1736255 RepID=UPI0006FD5015|nr:glutathione S-transferase family protein [Methylobacterium sp. Leaf106]KQP53237.1 glutathione S-transferase [Methylobacterium sp. Leaf106]